MKVKTDVRAGDEGGQWFYCANDDMGNKGP
jgi:hypothetical protein